MRLIVAHPETQHSYQAALGLYEARLLELYMTGVSLKRSSWLAPILARVRPAVLQRLRQHRQHEAIPRALIRSWLPAAALPGIDDRSRFRLQHAFGRAVGRTALRRGCGVLGFNTNALETFRLLERDALPGVLDQSIAHRRFSNREGSREAEAWPQWGEQWTAPQWRVDAEDEELALADHVLCGSTFCADTLVEFGVPRQRISVVPYGTDTARFTPAASPATRPVVRILFVGSVSLRKGFHYLLEAVRRLRTARVHVTLVGGSAVNADELRQHADIASHIPYVLHEAVPQLFRDHDLYVFPSLVEGSSISVYEALASGLPVITTPNSGSIVEDGVSGIIVAPRDVDALATAIDRLATDAAERRSMAIDARALAERTGDWRHYRDRLVQAVSAVGAIDGDGR